VPVLVIEGEAICGSRRIIEHLEYRREREQAGAVGSSSTSRPQ
jgi:hypothetical protein